MLAQSKAFSGMAVRDIEAAKRFYGGTLGIEIEVLDEANGLLSLKHSEERETLLYLKPDHTPSNNTVLNFPVDDIDAAVDELTARGVKFEHYDEFPPDEKGIARGRAAGRGPDVAWFKDPEGNILSVLQES
jgi:predicted enzyme related to lactoylglutathione lyase